MRHVNRIADTLKQEIQSARIAVSSFLPTEKQLQARFDVSRSTIRRAVEDLISEGWAERHPNRGVLARMGPVGPKSSIIGFIDHADDVHKSLFFFLGQYLSEKGLHLVHVDSTRIGTLGALEKAAESGFAASVFWGKEVFCDPNRFAAIQSKMPVVAVDHCPNGISADVVRGDHFGGARQAVGHLLSLGREEIAISGIQTLLEDTQQRLLGYAAAHFDQNRFIRAHNILYSAATHSVYDDPRMLIQRLSDEDRPDAIFVLHDLSAPAIASAIFDLGLRIPEDVAIVGFGNDLPFTLGNVGLTTIAMDWREIAQTLMKRVQYRLETPNAPVEQIVLPTHLVIRGSCGAPRDQWQGEEYQVSSVTLTRRMPPNVWRSEFGSGANQPIPNSLSIRGTKLGTNTSSNRIENI